MFHFIHEWFTCPRQLSLFVRWPFRTCIYHRFPRDFRCSDVKKKQEFLAFVYPSRRQHCGGSRSARSSVSWSNSHDQSATLPSKYGVTLNLLYPIFRKSNLGLYFQWTLKTHRSIQTIHSRTTLCILVRLQLSICGDNLYCTVKWSFRLLEICLFRWHLNFVCTWLTNQVRFFWYGWSLARNHINHRYGKEYNCKFNNLYFLIL